MMFELIAVKLRTFKPCQNYEEMYGVQPKRPAKHTFFVILEIFDDLNLLKL